MPDYKASLRDMRFLHTDVFDAPVLAERVDADTAEAILEEAAKLTGACSPRSTAAATNRARNGRTARSAPRPASARPTPPMPRAPGWAWPATPSTAAWAC